jgi:hypothetical protein
MCEIQKKCITLDKLAKECKNKNSEIFSLNIFYLHKSCKWDWTQVITILRVLHIAIHCPLPAAKIRGRDIDLIFGMWLYLDELQSKLEFRSGRMIVG